ncbi:peptidase M1-like protein [Melghirimyces profundicolus]|uniref:Peptidase M1-like protein n=1 Tax=Melghirimyces profundicolus TaxID=1242148 RepID=A0A2T6C4F5_9BACL|nr:M1 family metallopeptidase [Melghirimyces profundicolus]PTX63167.1 peptidase M1-like protein [Melghirimyces profundicolus]
MERKLSFRCLIALGTAALLLGTAAVPALAVAEEKSSPFDAPGVYRPSMPAGSEKDPLPKTSAAKKEVRGPSDPSYKMDVKYDSTKHQINGTLTVRFANNLGMEMKDIWFNVWANAETFRENGGVVEIHKVKVDGTAADFSLKGTGLHIKGLSIPENASAKVQMEFTVQVPEAQDRFGWYGTTVSLGNWFPILAVYDDEGWNVDPYYPYGESFYSLSGNFDVRLTTDKEQVVAATGTRIGKPKVSGKWAVHRFKAKNVRDFAIELDPTYKVKSGMAGKVKVNVYYTEKHAKFADAMLESGIESIELFSEKYGQYPWPELDVVSMEGWFGGMEYPQLIMMSLNDNRTEEWVKSVVAHENGHQWFYGLLGNNEYDEPWLDESFATFSAALYDGELEDYEVPPVDDPYYHLSSPVSAFTARGEEGIYAYYRMIYGYGASTLNDLREKLGDRRFYEGMQTYFQENLYGVTTTRDFIDTMERTSGEDLSQFFHDHRVYLSDQE